MDIIIYIMLFLILIGVVLVIRGANKIDKMDSIPQNMIAKVNDSELDTEEIISYNTYNKGKVLVVGVNPDTEKAIDILLGHKRKQKG